MPTPDLHAMAVTLYEERLKNDAWALRELMHEKATWEVMGYGRSDEPGRTGGAPSSMAGFIQEVLATWRWQSYELLDVLADGSRIFCRYRVTVKHVPSGKLFNTQGAEFFRMQDGYIREVVSYPDPRLVQQLAETSGAA